MFVLISMLILVFIFMLWGIFYYKDNKEARDTFWFCVLILMVSIPGVFITDYVTTSQLEKDIKIQYENLVNEGKVIDSFSNNVLIKSDNAISLENNNQASEYIISKTKWIDAVKKHNNTIADYVWRHEQNSFLIYISFGLSPFKSNREVNKYKININ